VTVTREQLNLAVFHSGDDAVAVEFDFVTPIALPRHRMLSFAGKPRKQDLCAPQYRFCAKRVGVWLADDGLRSSPETRSRHANECK